MFCKDVVNYDKFTGDICNASIAKNNEVIFPFGIASVGVPVTRQNHAVSTSFEMEISAIYSWNQAYSILSTGDFIGHSSSYFGTLSVASLLNSMSNFGNLERRNSSSSSL